MAQRDNVSSFGNDHAKATGKVRVLVVDDSAFMRHLITRELSADQRIEIIGVACNGVEAIAKARETQPDVITMDIEMPQMNGLEALPRVFEVCSARVVMLSSCEGVGQANTVRALELGAVDFILKPSGSISPNLSSIREMMIRSVHNAATATVHRRTVTKDPPLFNRGVKTARSSVAYAHNLVVIGCSTGGPQALTTLLPMIPGDINAGIIIVQHMPAGFTTSLAARLNDTSAVSVREAAQGDIVMNNEVLVTPGDFHLRLVNENGALKVKLDQGPRLHGVRPAVDITFNSAAEVASGRVSGVVMTGMGHDGTAGAASIRQAGGWIIAQDQASCVIYGMPRSVVETNQATTILPLKDIANGIVTHLAKNASRKGTA